MRRIAPCASVLRAVVPATVIALAAAGHAQQTLGNLNGTVTDATGAAIAGAQVQLNGDANGVKLTTTSKKDGNVSVPKSAGGQLHAAVYAAGV